MKAARLSVMVLILATSGARGVRADQPSTQPVAEEIQQLKQARESAGGQTIGQRFGCAVYVQDDHRQCRRRGERCGQFDHRWMGRQPLYP